MNGRVVYDIITGNDIGLFAINPFTGLITTTFSLSPDNYQPGIVQLQVIVSDLASVPEQQLTTTTVV